MTLLWLLSTFVLINTAISAPQPRIIGGDLAFAGQFPFAAAIYKTTANGNYFCGGSVISTLWVLTAGQCADGAIVFTIILGTTHLEEENENRLRVATETYFLHPDYNPETLENDIAMIRFREAITMTTYIGQAITTFSDIDPGSEVIALGWGQTSDAEGVISNDLQWVELTTLSNEECRIYYGNQVVDTMTCAIGPYNEGSCYGDIGGALVQRFGAGNMYGIVGIASFISANGCESIYPSGYTRQYLYSTWIRNITNSGAL